MPKFEDDILTPEEESSGFNPGEPDDDTFMLKSEEAYPEVVPQFDENESLIDHKENTPELIQDDDILSGIAGINESEEEEPELEEELNEVESDEDLIDNDEEIVEEEQIISQVPEEENVGSAWDAFDDNDNDEERLSSDKTELEKEEDVIGGALNDIEEEDTPAFQNDEEDEEEETENQGEAQEETDAQIEAVEVDDELQSMLQSQLEKGKKRKKDKDKIEKEERKLAEKAEKNKREKPEVDENSFADEKIINLNKIEAESPSKYYESAKNNDLSEEVNEIEAEQNRIKEQKAKENEKIKELIEEKEKEKKRFPILAVASTAAVTLVLAGAAFLIYYLYFMDKPTNSLAESTKVVDSTSSDKKISEKIIEKIEEKDTTKLLEKKEDEILEAEPEEPIRLEIEKELAKESKIAIKPKEKQVKKKLTKKDRPITPKETPIKIKPKKEVAEDNIPVEIETESEEITSIDNKALAETFINEEIPVQPERAKDEIGIYKVQVYSSLSYDDALEWLSRLKEMKVEDAIISEHKIRDQVWYRVRFGKFSTRAEARTAASQYGFSQTWIDRIK